MDIKFYGATETVTGSMTLITIHGKTILLDCGLYQGNREDCYFKNQTLPFDVNTIDAMILSHAHIDHSGNIPLLVKMGYTGPIYCTSPTLDLCKVMLVDSANIQAKDLAILQKLKKFKNVKLEPSYTPDDVERAVNFFVPIEYDIPTMITPDVMVTLYNSGHILGAASIVLEYTEHGVQKSIGYTGDIGHSKVLLMDEPNVISDVDYLIIESTYGDREHPVEEDSEEELAKAIVETYNKRGRLVIPAFSVGRMQGIVYLLHRLYDENRIPNIPIFIDSPLGVKATNIFTKYSYELNREVHRNYIDDGIDPFNFNSLTYIESNEDSDLLNIKTFPAIIVSASGMAEGGKVVKYIKTALKDTKSMILFSGYAAEGTLARNIMDHTGSVKIEKDIIDVKCSVRKLNSMSAHAGRHDLVKYVLNNNPSNKLDTLFLVHGSVEALQSLKQTFSSNGYNTKIPKHGEIFNA